MSPMIWLQHALPHRLLSGMAHRLARWRFKPYKNAMIGAVVRHFNVAMDEAVQPDPFAYEHFNAFFTRALKPGVRHAPTSPDDFAMPCDGRVSQVGDIRDGRIFQAKGHDYTAAELLGDAEYAAQFDSGVFANMYLAPRDYHRVHMPWRGRLLETLHIPGRLFSVNPKVVAHVPRLFARNERLVCRFETEFGPMAVVMVGALLVSGVETVWGGEEIPPYVHKPRRRDWRSHNIELDRFAEMARFNYGSTVIVLLPKGVATLADLAPEASVRLGQVMATRCR